MLWFIVSVLCLLAGYFIYGTLVERVFSVREKRPTPAWSERDGVDYVPMSRSRVFLVQLLNIAGIGPVFGPIMGALYGPAAMLWIVVGCIFAGGVHDYFSGMLSVRHKGHSVPALAGVYLGTWAKHLVDAFALILLLLVGVVFILAPANLLERLTGYNSTIFVFLIFAYCFFATIVPVDKILGRLYPLFGLLLLIMSLGMILALCFSSNHRILPNVAPSDFFRDFSADTMPLWPALFITIACGAISGFHATQSPLMARCLENEKQGRFVFYGAMIGEGLIALVWCMVALSCFDGMHGLRQVMQGSPANVVYTAARELLGGLGGTIAILGVVVLPITSGDTAFRSARLIVAEFFGWPQVTLSRRLLLALPLFLTGAVLCQVDFGIVWRYFGVANQATAAVMLWTASSCLLQRGGHGHWITTVPAFFMTTVVLSFLLISNTMGLGQAACPATLEAIGISLGLAVFVIIHAKRASRLSVGSQRATHIGVEAEKDRLEVIAADIQSKAQGRRRASAA
ncbi:MAG: carbon starvation protein A [Kistimonas sp.]|nr:carbon starvation protein A [Kistimonas sp.]